MIKTLDPKQNPSQPTSAPGGGGGGGQEVQVAGLKSQLSEKDRVISSLEHETEKARAVREMEERLISSAFYNLSMQMHRTAVENRSTQPLNLEALRKKKRKFKLLHISMAGHVPKK